MNWIHGLPEKVEPVGSSHLQAVACKKHAYGREGDETPCPMNRSRTSRSRFGCSHLTMTQQVKLNRSVPKLSRRRFFNQGARVAGLAALFAELPRSWQGG